jgi:membrane fusion protein (multidrug efflux system)
VRSGGVSATDIDTAVGVHLRAKAKLQEAQAALDQSALDLAYTRIEAPIGGRIGRTAFTAGNLVGPSSGPLARLVQIDPIRVVFAVSETEVTAIKMARETSRNQDPDDKLVPQIRFAQGEVYPTAGRLAFVDNQVDPATGTIAVRAVFDNPTGLLLPGQYVTVVVRRSTPRRMPLVPQAAVQEDREGRYVFVVDAENRAQQRRITTGAVIDTDWVVEAGLMTGETIIVQGVQKVRPGQTVETVEPSRAPKD